MDVIDRNLIELVRAFPRIFKGHPPRMTTYVDDGWHRLVMELFARIDPHLSNEQSRRFQVVQIKEKLGRLRIYFRTDSESVWQDGSNSVDASALEPRNQRLRDEVRALSASAEDASSRCCQVCGSNGQLRQMHGLKRVLCDLDAAAHL